MRSRKRRRRALASGMTMCLVKPIGLDVLRDVLRDVLLAAMPARVQYMMKRIE